MKWIRFGKFNKQIRITIQLMHNVKHLTCNENYLEHLITYNTDDIINKLYSNPNIQRLCMIILSTHISVFYHCALLREMVFTYLSHT